jgi:HEAT repeat protein
MNIKTNLFSINNSAFLKLSTLLLIFTFAVSALPQNAFAFTAKTPADASSTEDDNFDKKFREGRDLIDKQDWTKAAEKFSEVINQYPTNKSVDAALYWLAFCYKKQRNFEKVGATVDRLIKDYPQSSWTSDARVLLIEVAQPAKVIYGTTGQNVNVATVQGNGVTISNTYSAGKAALKQAQPLTITSATTGSDAYAMLSGFYASETPTPLDREDEIKIAAFQSLLSADSEKGVEAMSDILKPNSKSSETLQVEVLRVVRRPAIRLASPSVNLEMIPSVNIAKSPTPLIKEALMKSLKNDQSAKIRTETIYTLASLKDEQTISYLSELYNSESNQEVKKAIINGLGSSWGFGGFYSFSNTFNGTVINSAKSGSGQNINVTTEKADADKKPEFIKLLEIVKTEKNPELRRLALSNVQRFAGWQKNAQMVDVLSGIYDSETDENFKKYIIQSLARFDQPQAAKKLLDIAKTDKSDKLKLEAIYALGKSKDPAAVTYLQQVLQ